ncbi:MAG TPA: hypothetical protein P5068_11690 [Sedimentisphaerales bacterium]|nr:hypothetical protein [Sedimentisphaerales bacterium]HRV48420.1 hypothetical protein [Sedimentisphaerales bacterium]
MKLGRAIRYRLVLQKLTERVLPRLRIHIEFYYWTQEGQTDDTSPGSDSGFEDCTFSPFGPDEIRTFVTLVPWRSEAELLQRFDEGKLCFGARYRGQIAAFVWCDLAECTYVWHRIALRENEVYLFDQFTRDAFRGMNVAPYLRHRTYEALRRMGRNTFYSVTHRFNSSAVRFKQKLGARFLWLGVGINLFGKVRWHAVLRRYPRG